MGENLSKLDILGEKSYLYDLIIYETQLSLTFKQVNTLRCVLFKGQNPILHSNT